MKLQDQCCTIQQGAKLFNYAITDSVFAHACNKDGAYDGLFLRSDEGLSEVQQVLVPAFTVAELGVMLPDGEQIGSAQIKSFRVIATQQSYGNIWECWAENPRNKNYYEDLPLIAGGTGNTEAESRAELLIHLLESGKITAAEVNARLSA